MVRHPIVLPPQPELPTIWSMRGGDGKTPISPDIANALGMRAGRAGCVIGDGVLERVRRVVPAGDDATRTRSRRTGSLPSGRG